MSEDDDQIVSSYEQGAMETYPSSEKLVSMGQRVPIRKKLEIRIKQKEKELTELKDALAVLDKNPEYENLHDILAKISHYL